MTRIRVAAALLVVSVGGSSSSAIGAAPSLYTYTVTLGDPQISNVPSVIFDGQYIWAGVQDTSTGSGSINKLTTSGQLIATAQVGSAPLEMAYDGANVWVSDYGTSDVTIVKADGVAVIKTIALPGNANPEGILFDGRYVWVANNGAGANSVSKFDAASLSLIATYTVGGDPDGIAFDGTYVWITNSYDATVVKVNRETGEILRTYSTGIFPLSILYDGRNMWVGNGPSDSGISPLSAPGYVLKLRANGGVNLGTFAVGNGVRGLAYDGMFIWACNGTDNTLTRIRAVDGARMGTYPVGKSPRAIAFDGVQMWIANSGEPTLTVVTPRPDPVMVTEGATVHQVVPQLLPPIEGSDVGFAGTSKQPSVKALGGILNFVLGDN